MTEYSIDRTISGPFDQALQRVKAALIAEGFGTLSEIDIRTILREKIGKDIPPYTVLGVCNPHLAAQAIDLEPKIGVFLPCTVLVREDGESILVSAQDPGLMESMIGNASLEPISSEARLRIERALESI